MAFIRFFFLFWCIAALAGCTASTDIDTPREITRDTPTKQEGKSLLVSIIQNGISQNMALVDNRFECAVISDAQGQHVRMKVELQNIALNSMLQTNSIYFRCDSIPVDGNIYSLSGDPLSISSSNAAKIIFALPGSGLQSVIPAQTTGASDNFQLILMSTNDPSVLRGILTYNTTLPGSANTSISLDGTLTIRF